MRVCFLLVFLGLSGVGLAQSRDVRVVLNFSDGRVLSGGGAGGVALPGSTLKPLVLAGALERGLVSSKTTVDCSGEMRIMGRNLACLHPRGVRVLDAETALAYSCNQWFAQLAEHISGGDLRAIMNSYGVVVDAMDEARGTKVLTVLGLRGSRVSATQLAEAYRRLAIEMQKKELGVVKEGLLGSVRYGMAHGAAVDGMEIAGKTGTASEPGQSATHGWFAGILYKNGVPDKVVVVYVARGSGGDAAVRAGRVFRGLR